MVVTEHRQAIVGENCVHMQGCLCCALRRRPIKNPWALAAWCTWQRWLARLPGHWLLLTRTHAPNYSISISHGQSQRRSVARQDTKETASPRGAPGTRPGASRWKREGTPGTRVTIHVRDLRTTAMHVQRECCSLNKLNILNKLNGTARHGEPPHQHHIGRAHYHWMLGATKCDARCHLPSFWLSCLSIFFKLSRNV